MSKAQKYLIEFILFSAYALFAMSWKTGDMLIAQRGFGTTELATMTNAINAAKIVGSLCAAVVLAKLGYRKMFSASTGLIVLGVLLPFVAGFAPTFVIRFILGLGGAWVLVSINPVVAKIFNQDEIPVVNGLNAVAFNVGLAVVLTFSNAIKENPAWVIQALSGVLVLCIALWLLLTPKIDDQAQDFAPGAASQAVSAPYRMRDGLKERFNWVFALSYSGLLSFYLVSFTFMKPENVRYVIYAGVVGALVGTFQGKRFKEPLKLVRVSAFLQLLSALGFVAFYDQALVKVLGLLLGFFIFFPMPAFITLAFSRKGATPEKISVTFSIFWALSYFVSIVVLQSFAAIKTSVGTQAAFVFILCVASSFFLGTNFFMQKEKT